MLRSPVRKALLVSTLALAALTALAGSAGAQPAPDHDGDYSAPYWIYANPGVVDRADIADPEPGPWFVAWGQDAGTR